MSLVFQEVGRHPEHLLGEGDDPRQRALARIVGSVAAALGSQPSFLVDSAGLLRVMGVAIRSTLQNIHGLLDLDAASLRTQPLYVVLRAVVSVLEDESLDERALVTREVFVEIVERALPLLAANIRGGEGQVVKGVVRKVLLLASGVLKHRTSGASLALLVEELLRRVLWGELDLQNQRAVEEAARNILRES